MTDDFEIHEQAPTDSEGHPIHPERGHRICGARKSDKTTPTSHGRERDEYAYCLQPAGWGTETDYGACRNHPYTGSQIGEQNPNFKHGKTSEYFKSKLSERQRDVYDEWVDTLDDPEDASKLLGVVGYNLVLRGEHAENPSMIREGRQILETFSIEPNPGEMNVNLDGTVEHEHQHDVPEHVVEAIAGAAEANLEGGDS